ncbi:MAG: zinc-binding dehydrogenase [Deltaproteobacteria bacterium]|jgi:NADPH:quinone reductase-like Zn-dependent oxidoreductase|nr:zinc-binding dehydrogenase [Deltaproteobacteria bacterium]MBT6501059.1 zinc-binding dehydrogenase [Deltaproteobacteria bacterium]MBT7155952.1 zinc-binding dehydrogenase [Deltaproteobacteria bacterium]
MNTIPNIMSGIQLTGHGNLDKLVLRKDIPVPSIGARDVLIKVSAAGVNNTDINTRTAWYSKSGGNSDDASWSGNPIQFPRIQGADVCGRVVAVGEQVEKNLLNERVLIEPCIREAGGSILKSPWYFGSECDGGFAEYTVVAARHTYKINSSLSDAELASFPCSYSTAENMLTRANVTANDTVMVTGASGGVGSAAIQLAKARGAKVIAITSSSKSADVLSLGADRTLSRTENVIQTLGKNSIDVVIDLVAGKQWPDHLEVLKPFGRYATAGAIAGPLVELDVRTLYLKDLSLFGCTVLGEEVFGNLIKRIEAAEINSIVANTFALSQIAEAQQQFELKKHVGKLVIDISIES